MINIGVLGTGYVGLVTGACLASTKTNIVTCMDIDDSKIELLKEYEMPIYEQDLELLVRQNCHDYRLFFDWDIPGCLDTFDVIFIAVGTPTAADGSVNLDYVQSACNMIREYCTSRKVIVMKSTVPVTTHEKMEDWLGHKHTIISNPEFLREGTAVYDFTHGDRIVVGTVDGMPDPIMKAVYTDHLDKVIWTDNASAEMVKYASNCLLAAKLALWNEIAVLCGETGANIHDVKTGVGADSRIGPRFLLAGPGYGGSCFPKDTRGLHQMFTEHMKGTKYGKLIKAVIDSNDYHKSQTFRLLWSATLNSWRADMKIAIIGLAFKGGTDDVRESPTHALLEQMDNQLADYETVVIDPVATELPETRKPVELTTDLVKGLKGADVVVLMTEWQQYKNIDIGFVKSLMRGNIIVDARNMWSRAECERNGLVYYGIGC